MLINVFKQISKNFPLVAIYRALGDLGRNKIQLLARITKL